MQVYGKDMLIKLRLLAFARIIIALFFLGGAFFFQHHKGFIFDKIFSVSFDVFYLITILMIFVSLVYLFWNKRTHRPALFAFVQLALDVVLVTVIIWITGSYESLLSFLYLLVIINSSIILSRRGSLIIAALSVVLFGLLLNFEYYDLLPSFSEVHISENNIGDFYFVLFRIIITIIACFSVAILSSLLSVQLGRTREEMQEMKKYLKRMENLALIGELAAVLAHKIKNPLASLRGAVELLEGENDDDLAFSRLMNIIRRESDHLTNFISEFLFFAKPGEAKLEPLNLADLIDKLVKSIRKGFYDRDYIEYSLDLEEDVWVEADFIYLSQALRNLILNAIESIEREGRIEISLLKGKNSSVSIIIKDNGCGIKEDKKAFIFDPFYTTKPNGTGLGLPLVMRVLDSIGGRLSFEDNQEAGSLFTVFLPCLTKGEVISPKVLS